MNKREFLKRAGAFAAGSMWPPLMADEQEHARSNWSGNYTYSARRLHVPRTVDEVRQVVKNCSKLKALGTRHSFNGIADSKENQISLQNLKQTVLDRKSRSVTVGAGVRYGDLAPYLYKNGFALHNLASLPHISVAGARSTATHGSGSRNGNLATAVSGIELVTADGALVPLSREKDGERFQGRFHAGSPVGHAVIAPGNDRASLPPPNAFHDKI